MIKFSMVGMQKVMLSPAAGGVKSDYEKLMSRYAAEKSVRYEVFATIWKDMNMSEIFCLRQTDRECREFTEECMYYAMKYTLTTYEFQTRVCALYILYALYHKQICSPEVKIRVTLGQWQHLMLLLHEARDQKHLDVEYVLQSLIVDNAFTFTAMSTHLWPGRNELKSTQNIQPGESHFEIQEPSIVSEILQPENIDQLSAIHEQYHMMKCMLQGPGSAAPDESLNVIKPNLVQQLTKIVAAHQEKRKVLSGKSTKRTRRDSGQTTSESEMESDSDVPMSPKRTRHSERNQSHGSRRAAIKAKAYSKVPTAKGRRRSRSAAQADLSFSSPEPTVRILPPGFADETSPEPLNEITTLDSAGDFDPLSMPMLTNVSRSTPKRGRGSRGGGKTRGRGRRKIGRGGGNEANMAEEGEFQIATPSPMRRRGRGGKGQTGRKQKKTGNTYPQNIDNAVLQPLQIVDTIETPQNVVKRTPAKGKQKAMKKEKNKEVEKDQEEPIQTTTSPKSPMRIQLNSPSNRRKSQQGPPSSMESIMETIDAVASGHFSVEVSSEMDIDAEGGLLAEEEEVCEEGGLSAGNISALIQDAGTSANTEEGAAGKSTDNTVGNTDGNTDDTVGNTEGTVNTEYNGGVLNEITELEMTNNDTNQIATTEDSPMNASDMGSKTGRTPAKRRKTGKATSTSAKKTKKEKNTGESSNVDNETDSNKPTTNTKGGKNKTKGSKPSKFSQDFTTGESSKEIKASNETDQTNSSSNTKGKKSNKTMAKSSKVSQDVDVLAQESTEISTPSRRSKRKASGKSDSGGS